MVVIMVVIALKTSASQEIFPSCFDDEYRSGRFLQLHIPHFPSIQRTGDGAGGCHFIDYLKVGVPLTFIVLPVLMVIMFIFWPSKR
jgi:hypothetical protein